MARIRTIKPDFFRHEGLFEAERDTQLPLRVAFAGLWTACDREGRFRWHPRQLKLDCLPYDDVDFSRVLDALMTRGHVAKYVVDGKEYGFIPSWREHQIVNNRESLSTLPEPNPNNVLLTGEQRVLDASPTRHDNYTGEGKGKEGKGSGVADATSSKFFFEDGVIRLTEKDFQKWKEAFSNLDLRAELMGLSSWAAEQKNNWFHAVKGALNKRNREIDIALKKKANGPPESEFKSLGIV